MNASIKDILSHNFKLFSGDEISEIYIIGTASSLNQTDLNRLKNKFCISVGSFYLHTDFNDISNLHLLTDPEFFKEDSWTKATAKTKELFTKVSLGQKLVFPFKPAYDYLAKNNLLNSNTFFLDWDFSVNEPESINLTQKVPAWGQNVLSTALLLALSTKVKSIFLVGFEHGGVFTGEEKVYSDFRDTESKRNEINKHTAINPRFFSEALKIHIKQLNGIKRYASKNNIKIFTTSATGALRLFPYKELALKSDYTNIIKSIKNNLLNPSKPNLLSLFDNQNWCAISNQSLWKKICQYNSLFRKNTNDQDVILFIKKLDIDLISAYLGAIMAGRIPGQVAPPSNKMDKSEYEIKINHLIHSTSAKSIFTDIEIQHEISSSNNINVLTNENLSEELDEDIYHHNIALTQFSSGSTGLQKGVKLSHQSLINHMDDYYSHLQLESSDKVISWLPLYHDMGLIACFLMPLIKGYSTMMMDPFLWLSNPKFLFESIKKEQATLCYLPNFAYHLLARNPSNIELPSLKYFINCSEPAKDETHSLFSKAFPNIDSNKLTVCYALAENTFAVSQSLYGEREIKRLNNIQYLSTGRILSNTKVKIINTDNNGVGEVLITSPYTFTEFTDGTNPKEDSYYNTGDLGFIEEEQLYITGRKKDILIINGKNIYPQDIEYIASEFPSIHPGRVCCFSVENQQIGSEEIFLLVEIDNPIDEKQLRLKIEKEMNISIRKVISLSPMTLIKTSSGKISRARNKELYIKGEFKC